METKDIYVNLLQKMNCPDPNSVRMHKIIRKLVTPQEGELLLALPAEPAELARKTGMPEETVQRKLQEFHGERPGGSHEQGTAPGPRRGPIP